MFNISPRLKSSLLIIIVSEIYSIVTHWTKCCSYWHFGLVLPHTHFHETKCWWKLVGIIGIGGVLRDCVGRWVLGLAQGEALHAKLVAVKMGLKICWNHGCKSLVCETNCLEVVLLFEWNSRDSHWDAFHGHVDVMKNIQVLLEMV